MFLSLGKLLLIISVENSFLFISEYMHTLDIPVCLAIQTRGRDLYSFLVSAVINHNDAMKSAYRVLYECKCHFSTIHMQGMIIGIFGKLYLAL